MTNLILLEQAKRQSEFNIKRMNEFQTIIDESEDISQQRNAKSNLKVTQDFQKIILEDILQMEKQTLIKPN